VASRLLRLRGQLPVIRRLDPANLPPAVREANERRMAAFIGLALHERVGLDTRRSVVFYDQISCSTTR